MGAAPEEARARLWVALAANAVVLPGLGSLVAGRRSGWVQAALALTGSALSLAWLWLVVADLRRAGALPESLPRVPLLVVGVALFAAGWLWALHTAWSALRGGGGPRQDD
jgi:hypothetical protein